MPGPTRPVEEHALLVDRYEQLRSQALAGRHGGGGHGGGGHGGGHGLALLAARGVAAWMAAWRSLRPTPAPLVAPAVPADLPAAVPAGRVAGPGDEVVSVLAAMATACLGG